MISGVIYLRPRTLGAMPVRELFRAEAVRGRQRVVLGAFGALAALVAGSLLVNLFVLRAEWWQVDHTTTPAPQPLLYDLGPPAGPLAASWRLGTPVRDSDLPAYDRVVYRIVDGQVVVASGHGLDVRDAGTGGPRWHYRRAGWSLLGWSSTQGRVLVAYLERTGHRQDRQMVGLDAVSGALLWRLRGVHPAAVERTALRWPSGAGVTIVTGHHTLTGRSATSGGRLWSHRLPPGCALLDGVPYGSGSSESVAAFALDCRSGDGVLAVDPRSGRTLWRKPAANAAITVTGDAAVVYDDKGLHAYDRAGREFVTRTGADLCHPMCPAQAVGGRLLIALNAPDGRLESIDIATGTVQWHHDTRHAGYVALTSAGGRVYALREQVGDALLPAGIDILDATSGKGSTVPVPVVERSGLSGAQSWLSAGGGLLYVAAPLAVPRPFGAARLTALHAAAAGNGPAELGGVPSADWPDACSLLSSRDLPGRYEARPVTTRFAGPRLTVGCTYRPTTRHDVDGGPRTRGKDPESGKAAQRDAAARRDGAALTVSVQWVGRDQAQVTGLFAEARNTQPNAHRLTGVGDEAYDLGTPSGTVTFRVGRVIVTVTAPRSDTATKLARAITARLRGH